MNEFEAIEQDLARLAVAKPPSNLRSNVLNAIQSQREADVREIIPLPCKREVAWLSNLERTATFATSGLLAMSLLIFAIVDRSANELYQGGSGSMAATQSVATRYDAKPTASEGKPADSPIACFRRHFVMLQQFNSELFYVTPKENTQTSDDRKPLGHLRPRFGLRVLQLASIAVSEGETGSAA